MSDLDRRQLLQLLAAAPAAMLLPLPPAAVQRAARHAALTVSQGQTALRFFTPEEWQTVRVLSDLIIPRDDRSGSATDAGVPEFMDWILAEYPERQTQIRGGLAWLDRESAARFGRRFVECAPGERTAVLDDIAWPAKARPELSAGVAFFTRFRDLVANGFYSSREGVKDLGYQGNTFVTEWRGCPGEIYDRLGTR